MTSKQVMLTLVALLCAACSSVKRPGADPLVSPYAERRVWAIAPLRNESGSLQVDTAALADNLARQLENASNLDVVAVNRTLAAMEALGMREVTSTAEAMRLLGVLNVDGLVVGSVTSYDPYDPPKLGMAIELYTSPRYESSRPVDPRGLTSAATPGAAPSPTLNRRSSQPVSVVSAFFDAADPDTRRKIQRYAEGRRQDKDDPLAFIKPTDDTWRLYRINMHLYSEFVSYVMSWRLLRAETERLAPPPPTPSTTTTASAPAPERQPAR